MLSPELLIAIGTCFVGIAIFVISSHANGKANSKNIEKLEVKIDKLDVKIDKLASDTKAQFAEINKVLLQNSQDVGYLIGLQSGDSFFKRRRAQMGKTVVRETAEAQA